MLEGPFSKDGDALYAMEAGRPLPRSDMLEIEVDRSHLRSPLP
jgi:hypothetical protein